MTFTVGAILPLLIAAFAPAERLVTLGSPKDRFFEVGLHLLPGEDPSLIQKAFVKFAKREDVKVHSEVDFVDAANGAVRSVRLVYPSDADIATGRISILTPVGAGLIGLRAGSAILWPDRDGQERALTIRAVLQPPRAA